MYSGFCNVEWTGSCSGSQYVSGIPYGNQTEANSLVYENGFKGARGAINEGHYLVFEANGYALSNPSDGKKQFGATKATAAHDAKAQRWIIHGVAEEGTAFNITSAVDGLYISQHSSLSVSVSGAEVYNIVYIGSSQYTLQKENGDYLNIAADGTLSFTSHPVPYNVYSVTYNY
jgi:phospholipase C